MMGLELDSQLIIKIRENLTTIDSILTIKRVVLTIFRGFHPIKSSFGSGPAKNWTIRRAEGIYVAQ